MICLVIGGAGSGKSEYAEKLTVSLSEKKKTRRVYLATMSSEGAEAEKRIARHRKNRAGRGFMTIEKTTGLAALADPEGGGDLAGAAVLLEDLGNLLAGELFLPEGNGPAAVREGIRTIAELSEDLVIVTNDVFSDGNTYTGDMLTYLKALAELNCALAEKAETVAEVICGIPRIRKGKQL